MQESAIVRNYEKETWENFLYNIEDEKLSIPVKVKKQTKNITFPPKSMIQKEKLLDFSSDIWDNVLGTDNEKDIEFYKRRFNFLYNNEEEQLRSFYFFIAIKSIEDIKFITDRIKSGYIKNKKINAIIEKGLPSEIKMELIETFQTEILEEESPPEIIITKKEKSIITEYEKSIKIKYMSIDPKLKEEAKIKVINTLSSIKNQDTKIHVGRKVLTVKEMISAVKEKGNIIGEMQIITQVERDHGVIEQK